ncbi:right-handed parallel beta-helix repeat-containing protein [Caldiplasma sukawensis]
MIATKNNVLIITAIVVVFVVGILGGYFIGMNVSPSKTTQTKTTQGYESGNIGIGNMTAKVIAKSNEVITGNINASGYTVGVYIGPGVTNVTVVGANITDANSEGILVLETNGITITNNYLTNNGLNSSKDGAIIGTIGLYGVSNSTVSFNQVVKNNVSGIVVASESPVVPDGISGKLRPMNSSGVILNGNIVEEDAGGCGIVVVAWGPAMMITNTIVMNNYVTGSVFGQHGPTGPYVGTIVIAADFPFAQANNNTVMGNTVIGGLEDGIIINNQASGAKDLHNSIINNYVKDATFQRLNNPPFDNATDMNLANETNGIAVYSNWIPQNNNPPPEVNFTVISGNTVVDEAIGIWLANAGTYTVSNNVFISVQTNMTSHVGESTTT